MTSWFEVDKEGLRRLTDGKPKSFILRELIQNAFDEKGVTRVYVVGTQQQGEAHFTVLDDAPEGFKNIADAWTLFGDTWKRRDAEARGRMNLGEKLAIARCTSAIITTTKGAITFEQDGTRSRQRFTTESGSKVDVWFKCSRADYKQIINDVLAYLPPRTLVYTVTDETEGDVGADYTVPHPTPLRSFEATLQTEIEVDGITRRTARKTTVDVYPGGPAILYELGLPVQEIECAYSLDVQQKVPLNTDRDAVPAAYLQDLYAETLNAMAADLKPETASATWVRLGSADERVKPEAMQQVITQRYGDKVVVANTNDRRSIDDAISHGYKVVYGSEMSGDEWANVKAAALIPTSSDLFGRDLATDGVTVDPDENMRAVADLAKVIAELTLGIELRVQFYSSQQATVMADYNASNNVLRFNVAKLGGPEWFVKPLRPRVRGAVPSVLEIIIHELGHSGGLHTQAGFHDAICRIGAELTLYALHSPGRFASWL